MLVSSHSPETLSLPELDRFLEAGWFRMGPNIFTTNFLNFDNCFYSAFWLRVDLSNYTSDKTFEKLTKRNAGFRVSIQPAVITSEKEALFTRYSQSVEFRTSTSIKELLYGKSSDTPFDTYDVTVYDGDTLIGVGYFDLGEHSAEGISSFYDPAYKKYSLGKYMIYLKIKFCCEQNMKYFYPGYVVPGYPAFDYKLTMGTAALQYLDVVSGRWLAIDKLPEVTPLKRMEQQLKQMQYLFLQLGVSSQVTYYEFFDAVLIPDLQDSGVLDYPIFLSWTDINENNLISIIVYDVVGNVYRLLRAHAVWKSEQPKADSIYNSYMLRPVLEVFACEQAVEVVSKLVQMNK